MVTFELRRPETVQAFLGRTEIPVKAPSLGGVESLLTLPAKTSHAGVGPERRARLGIGDGLIRMSVGLEDTSDLVEDLARALAT
jgi:cystathionine beta-lyase/cystathionine gamma-synthase